MKNGKKFMKGCKNASSTPLPEDSVSDEHQ